MTAPDRLGVAKTFKLFIDGKFPRSESGRSLPVRDGAGVVIAHASRASRKDLRDAVEAARRAQPGWAHASAYLRGQILYRLAEMLEARRDEFASLLSLVPPSAPPAAPPAAPASDADSSDAPAALAPEREVALSIDRLVHYAGWADKYAQVLGRHNPVATGHYNFTVPEPTGVVAVIAHAPGPGSLLALVSLLAPVLVPGNSAVVVASGPNPLVASALGEVIATSDVPAGVVNILTTDVDDVLAHLAPHRDIDAAHAAGLTPAQSARLRAGVAENLKRVTIRDERTDFADARACESVWWIEPFVEFKTIWHPAAS